MSKYTVDELADQLLVVIKRVTGVDADADMEISPDSNLIDEIGMDSIEAFEMVATLHELIDAEIPEDIDPASITTTRQLAAFILENYTEEQIERAMSKDFEQKVEELMADHELPEDFKL